MKPLFQRTTENSLSARLFFRFFCFYLAAFAVGMLLAARNSLLLLAAPTARLLILPIPLALGGGLLTVSNPYLLLLTAAKAFFDAAFFYRIVLLARVGSVSPPLFNACFLLLFLAAILYAHAASLACRFTHRTEKRDIKLLFSREFGLFLLHSLVLLLGGVLLLLLFARALALLPPLLLPR